MRALRAFVAAVLLPASAAAQAAADPVLAAMKAELERSMRALARAEKAPLYHLSYEVRETHVYDTAAELGARLSENERRYRAADVDARVGERRLDNTHQIKGAEGWSESAQHSSRELPIDDDPSALRAELWLGTDRAFKEALRRYEKVRANKAVTAAEEDPSDDFSVEKPSSHYDKVSLPDFDRAAWRARLRRLSSLTKIRPEVFDSGIGLSMRAENRYIVDSEGASVVTGNRYVRLHYHMSTRTEDGMDLSRSRAYDADRVEDLPSEERIEADMRVSMAELEALRAAPLAEPYTGPAIIRNRAAGVYFHEILGHRLEGHRQKIEEQGQTFAKKLGERIVAPFLSVYDDPTLERFGGRFLRGFYRFDDEGIPGQRVKLIEGGVLTGFLMSRSPIRGFPRSNGHGRRSSGRAVVARMGNLIVEPSKQVPYARLREMLIEEVKRRGKPYGLVFDDIEGGFTGTGRGGPQSFKVLPLLVYRVYPDGRPDEPVRGVDMVGTPLASFEKVLAAADDADIFNGSCGAESGWVPVSAVSPSLLISEIEVEKKAKSSEKPPILPPPGHDPRKP